MNTDVVFAYTSEQPENAAVFTPDTAPAHIPTPSVFGAPISICVNWGIPVYFCGDRQTAKRFVEAYLERCARVINERDLE